VSSEKLPFIQLVHFFIVAHTHTGKHVQSGHPVMTVYGQLRKHDDWTSSIAVVTKQWAV